MFPFVNVLRDHGKVVGVTGQLTRILAFRIN
jgi:hypothetical protein